MPAKAEVALDVTQVTESREVDETLEAIHSLETALEYYTYLREVLAQQREHVVGLANQLEVTSFSYGGSKVKRAVTLESKLDADGLERQFVAGNPCIRTTYKLDKREMKKQMDTSAEIAASLTESLRLYEKETLSIEKDGDSVE